MSKIRKKTETWVSKLHTNSEHVSTMSWCHPCLEVGISVQLTPRLYMKEELIDDELPHDAYDWLECRDCGQIVRGLV